MEFDTFKSMYAETMMNYQVIEHDIKYLYAYMLRGDVNEHLESIENMTLGQMIRMLKELDYSDNEPLIALSDYNFLYKICDNRNHWAHNAFLEFIYKDNWLYSREFNKEFEKLQKDHERVAQAANILEEIRVEYCSSHRR